MIAVADASMHLLCVACVENSLHPSYLGSMPLSYANDRCGVTATRRDMWLTFVLFLDNVELLKAALVALDTMGNRT